MFLTHCAQCAAPLDHRAPRCGICKTPYCGRDCQKLHWKQGGHKAICQEIKRGGGAEHYHADKKLKEAVAAAVEACADDTKGQTCYICMEGVKRRTGEGLVSGFCACRGGSSFAHVSCLAEQAKILVAEAEENNLSEDAINARLKRWYACRLCEQEYHGVVKCALGWACWKAYVGRPEAEKLRSFAIGQLGSGLYEADQYEDALSVQEAELAMMRRLGAPEGITLVVQSNLANTYSALGRDEEALRLKRDVYSATLKLYGEEHGETLREANNHANALCSLERYAEAKELLRRTVPVARRVLGESYDVTLRMRWNYADALCRAAGATLDDICEGVTTLEEIEPTARRVLGSAHPLTAGIERSLRAVQAAIDRQVRAHSA